MMRNRIKTTILGVQTLKALPNLCTKVLGSFGQITYCFSVCFSICELGWTRIFFSCITCDSLGRYSPLMAFSCLQNQVPILAHKILHNLLPKKKKKLHFDSRNLFHKEPDSKYFYLFSQDSLHPDYLSLPLEYKSSHRQ